MWQSWRTLHLFGMARRGTAPALGISAPFIWSDLRRTSASSGGTCFHAHIYHLHNMFNFRRIKGLSLMRHADCGPASDFRLRVLAPGVWFKAGEWTTARVRRDVHTRTLRYVAARLSSPRVRGTEPQEVRAVGVAAVLGEKSHPVQCRADLGRASHAG